MPPQRITGISGVEVIQIKAMKPQSLSPALTVDGTMGRKEICQMIANARKLANIYSSNRPFPHIVLKNIWDDSQLSVVAEECENFTNWDEQKNFRGAIGKRSCSTITKLPANVAALIHFCNSPKFLNNLEILTGETGLIPDPYLYGGGIHSTLNGGFLKMHTDFNWHERLQLYRRLNVLIYLNKKWDKKWGGDLELAVMRNGKLLTELSVSPDFNKTVIFTTTDYSFHGHPESMKLPAGVARNSIALYYYLSAKPKEGLGETSTDTRYMFRHGKDL